MHVKTSIKQQFNLVSSSIDFIGEKNYQNIVLMPLNKEMHAFIRFNNCFNYKVIGVVDSPKKGLIGRENIY